MDVNKVKKNIDVRVLSIEKLNFHCSDNLRLVWVLEGSIGMKFVGGDNKVKENEIEIININEPVEIYSERPNKVLIITISGDLCLKWNSEIDCRVLNIGCNVFFSESECARLDENRTNIQHLKEKIMELLNYEAKHDYCDNRKSELTVRYIVQFLTENFDDILMKLKEIPKIHPEQIERFIQIDAYMLKNLSEKITLNELASLRYVSAQYLSAEFKKKFNHSFGKILEYYRTVNAVKCLLNEKYSIGEAIAESGFSDDKYFYRAFKDAFGCSPKMFREENLQNHFVYTQLETQWEVQQLLQSADYAEKYREGIHIMEKMPYRLYFLAPGCHTIDKFTSDPEIVFFQGEDVEIKNEEKKETTEVVAQIENKSEKKTAVFLIKTAQ